MSITRNFDLRLTAGKSIPLTINVNQYDRDEQWVFTLYDDNGEQYVPSSGAIVGIKADNLGIINTASVVGGNVVVNETQQMTAAVGKNVFELLIDGGSHGTANFVVLVEPKPGDNADLSESDLSLIQQAIDSTSATAIAQGVADWMDDNLTPTTPVVDASLTVSGAAADAKKTGDEISDLKSQINSLEAIPHAVKLAMDDLFANMAYLNDSNAYATFHAWATAVNVISITAIYTQSRTVYTDSPLEELKTDLVVTASYDNGTTATVGDYELSGTLSEGTSTITVTYQGKMTTFTVTVTNGILYQLLNTTFTGDSSERVNSEIALLQTDADFTVAIDYDRNGAYTNNSFLFQCMEGVSPYYGFKFQITETGSQAVPKYRAISNGVSSQIDDFTVTATGSLKIVIRHSAGESKCDWKIKAPTGIAMSYAIGNTSKTITANLLIGGNGFIGSVNSFTIYNHRFTDTQTNDFLEVTE